MKALLGLTAVAGVMALAPAVAKADPVRVTACEPSSNIMGLETVTFSPQRH